MRFLTSAPAVIPVSAGFIAIGDAGLEHVGEATFSASERRSTTALECTQFKIHSASDGIRTRNLTVSQARLSQKAQRIRRDSNSQPHGFSGSPVKLPTLSPFVQTKCFVKSYTRSQDRVAPQLRKRRFCVFGCASMFHIHSTTIVDKDFI